MKKKVSILLAAIMLCTMTLGVAGTASAEKECRCYMGRSEVNCECRENGLKCECTYKETYNYTENGFEIYYFNQDPFAMLTIPITMEIGGYIYCNANCLGSDVYGFGLRAKKDSIELTIKDAYEAGHIDADELAEIVREHRAVAVGKLGDANDDGTVNMRDVLLMQKKLAKIETNEPYDDLFATGYVGTPGFGRPLDMKHVLTAQKIAARFDIDYEVLYSIDYTHK